MIDKVSKQILLFGFEPGFCVFQLIICCKVSICSSSWTQVYNHGMFLSPLCFYRADCFSERSASSHFIILKCPTCLSYCLILLQMSFDLSYLICIMLLGPAVPNILLSYFKLFKQCPSGLEWPVKVRWYYTLTLKTEKCHSKSTTSFKRN